MQTKYNQMETRMRSEYAERVERYAQYAGRMCVDYTLRSTLGCNSELTRIVVGGHSKLTQMAVGGMVGFARKHNSVRYWESN